MTSKTHSSHKKTPGCANDASTCARSSQMETNEMDNRYICSVDKEKVKGYDISPEYCRDFEERSTNDSQMDT